MNEDYKPGLKPMVKVLSLAFLIVLILFSCKGSDDDGGPVTTPPEDDGPDPTEPVDDDFTVSTLFGSTPAGNLVIGPDGYIYASDFVGTNGGFSNGNGQLVRRFTPDGQIETFVDFGQIAQPTGLAFDQEGNVFISQFFLNRVVKYDPNGQEMAIFKDIPSPTAIVFDTRLNETYVLSSGTPGSPQLGSNIYKIGSQGQVSIFASSVDFNGANGMVQGSNRKLYVTSWFSGVIHEVSTAGSVSFLAILPKASAGWLAINQDTLYATDRNANRVFKVSSLTGQVIEFAGSGSAGGQDGPVSTAQFSGPNGIAVSPNADTIYVSETLRRRIRMIVFDQN